MSPTTRQERLFGTMAFFRTFGADLFSVVGTVGVLATLVGLGLAIHQIRRSTTAPHAAIAALEESRRKYNHHIVNRASKMATQATAFVNGSKWTIASLRLSDIHDNLTEIAVNNAEWSELASRFQKMEVSFANLLDGTECSTNMKAKWIKLKTDLQTKINKFNSPFALPEQEPPNGA